MSSRITIDLGTPQLATLLKLEAAHSKRAIKDIVVDALESYFSYRKETQTVLKLAEKTFAEWDNPLDADYDKL